MKIAIVSRAVYPYVLGGMERFVAFLSNHLVKLGADVEVICVQTGNKDLKDEGFKIDFRIKEIDWPDLRPYILSYYIFQKRAVKYLQERDFDIIYWSGWAVGSLKHVKNTPSLANPHGLEPFKSPSLTERLYYAPMNRRLKYYYKRRIDKVVSEGGKITEEIIRFTGIDRNKIVEIPNGIDINYISQMKSRKEKPFKLRARNVFLCVARLMENKGIDILIKAFNEIYSYHDVELLIVGEGYKKKELKELVQTDRIRFTGRIPDEDLFFLYSQANLFVFPTLYEGMPTVILEAMACGLPVIATDIGAISTMVIGENGFIIPPGDIKALKHAMIRFLKLPEEKRREMGRNSYELVRSKFTWPKIAKKTIEVCEELLRNS
jgi:glycosyltransferase involved in cell wall biosynthesis